MEEKKPCELCNNLATMYCKSDQANLCWDCDARVHRANFLAAKHPRSLPCRLYQSPTPWSASGPRLAPIVSVCENCVDCRGRDDLGGSTRSSHGEGGGADSDCDGDSNGGMEDGDVHQENQVVPADHLWWSLALLQVQILELRARTRCRFRGSDCGRRQSSVLRGAQPRIGRNTGCSSNEPETQT